MQQGPKGLNSYFASLVSFLKESCCGSLPSLHFEQSTEYIGWNLFLKVDFFFALVFFRNYFQFLCYLTLCLTCLINEHARLVFLKKQSTHFTIFHVINDKILPVCLFIMVCSFTRQVIVPRLWKKSAYYF